MTSRNILLRLRVSGCNQIVTPGRLEGLHGAPDRHVPKEAMHHPHCCSRSCRNASLIEGVNLYPCCTVGQVARPEERGRLQRDRDRMKALCDSVTLCL